MKMLMEAIGVMDTEMDMGEGMEEDRLPYLGSGLWDGKVNRIWSHCWGRNGGLNTIATRSSVLSMWFSVWFSRQELLGPSKNLASLSV